MHAYMIIAHTQFNLLELLIRKLDDKRNDIFIHIDFKVKDFDFDYFSSLAKFSRVIFTKKRLDITWGDYSQVECEMTLLETAAKNEDKSNPYSYYHLISGVDLPIKTNDEIHSFFNENNGKEFVHFTSSNGKDFESRLRYYHFFRRRRNVFTKILAQISFRIQKALGVNRLKNKNIKVQKGCNWFSITGELARYIVDNLPQYKKIFNYSYCGDETFIQTIIVNSKFSENLFMPDCNNDHFACARLIDWERGNPYVWKMEDYDLIKSSACMFARKFDENVDKEIVKALCRK